MGRKVENKRKWWSVKGLTTATCILAMAGGFFKELGTDAYKLTKVVTQTSYGFVVAYFRSGYDDGFYASEVTWGDVHDDSSPDPADRRSQRRGIAIAKSEAYDGYFGAGQKDDFSYDGYFGSADIYPDPPQHSEQGSNVPARVGPARRVG